MNLPKKLTIYKVNDRVISIDKNIAYLYIGKVKGKTVIKSIKGTVYAIEFEKKINDSNEEAEIKFDIKKGFGAFLKLTSLRKIDNDDFDLLEFKKSLETSKLNKRLTINLDEDKNTKDNNKINKNIITKEENELNFKENIKYNTENNTDNTLKNDSNDINIDLVTPKIKKNIKKLNKDKSLILDKTNENNNINIDLVTPKFKKNIKKLNKDKSLIMDKTNENNDINIDSVTPKFKKNIKKLNKDKSLILDKTNENNDIIENIKKKEDKKVIKTLRTKNLKDKPNEVKNVKKPSLNDNKKINKNINNDKSLEENDKENITTLKKEFKNRISIVENHNLELQNKIQDYDIKLNKLDNLNIKITKEFDEFKENNSDLVSEKIKELETINLRLLDKNKEFEEEIYSNKFINEENIKNLKDCNDQISILNKESEENLNKISELKVENEKINLENNNFKEEKIKLNEKIEEFELDKQLQELNNQLVLENMDVPNNYEDLQEKYKNLELFCNSQERKFENDIDAYKTKISNLTQQILNIQNDKNIVNFDEIQNNNKSLTLEIENYKNKIIEFENSEKYLKIASDNLLKKDEQIEELKKELDEKINWIKETENINNLYDEVKDELLAEIESLTKILDEKNENIKSYDLKMEEKQKIIAEYKDKCDEFNLIIESLKEEMTNKNDVNNKKINNLLGFGKSYDRNISIIKKNTYFRKSCLNNIKFKIFENYYNVILKEFLKRDDKEINNLNINGFEEYDIIWKMLDFKKIEIYNKNLIDLVISNYIINNMDNNVDIMSITNLIRELIEMDKYYYIINKNLLEFKDINSFKDYYNKYLSSILELKEWYKFMLETVENNMFSSNNNLEKLTKIKSLIIENKNDIFNKDDLQISQSIENIGSGYLKLSKILINTKEFSKEKNPQKYYDLFEELKFIFNISVFKIFNIDMVKISSEFWKIDVLDDFFLIKEIKGSFNNLDDIKFISKDNLWNLRNDIVFNELNDIKNIKFQNQNILKEQEIIKEKNKTILIQLDKINTININLEKRISDYKEDLKKLKDIEYKYNESIRKINYLDNKKNKLQEKLNKMNDTANNSNRNIRPTGTRRSTIKSNTTYNPTNRIIKREKEFSNQEKKLLTITNLIYYNMKNYYNCKSINKAVIGSNNIDMPYFSNLLKNNKGLISEIYDHSKDIKEDISSNKDKLLTKLVNLQAVDINNKNSKVKYYNNKNDINMNILDISNTYLNNNNWIIDVFNDNNLSKLQNKYQIIGSINFNKDIYSNSNKLII